jgi:glycosyltransferase involved in cell wall biosynthesis
VARDLERVPARKVLVIHNGIDVDRYCVAGTRRTGAPVHAVTVGRLDPIKDQATMLRAVRLVVDQVPEFSLDIAGDGPSRPGLEALCASLRLSGHVRFHGYRGEVSPYLAEADLFILSSVSEGIPLALLEAMACGLPAVTTDVGGLPEVVVPGETGWLVPPRSPDALAEAMLRLLAEPVALDRMGRAARRRVEDQFNLKKVVAEYEQVYMESLARYTSTGPVKA